MEPQTKENAIVTLSFDFSLAIIEFVEELEDCRKYAIAKQLIRSGTSIGANVVESQEGESVKDFVHKLSIAQKEAAETYYWLKLCEKSKNYPDPKGLCDKVLVIRRILKSIIVNTINKHIKPK